MLSAKMVAELVCGAAPDRAPRMRSENTPDTYGSSTVRVSQKNLMPLSGLFPVNGQLTKTHLEAAYNLGQQYYMYAEHSPLRPQAC
jgi:hypothetical protein